MVSLYYRDSNAAILVFDYTQPNSLNNLSYWVKELEDRVDAKSIVIKIVGNKYDLYKNNQGSFPLDEVKKKVQDLGQSEKDIINTSALTGENVLELFESVAQECFDRFA